MSALAFIDTETTGLDERHHEVWEIAYVLRGGSKEGDYLFAFAASDLAAADSSALRLNGYYDRHRLGGPPACDVAAKVAYDLAGRHLVGAVPDFDTKFLAKFLRAHGYAPAWHYHLIDVEAMMVGALAARGDRIDPPWNSRDLARRFGVEQDASDEHTALGDARWAMQIYEAVLS